MDVDSKHQCIEAALDTLADLGITAFPVRLPDLVKRVRQHMDVRVCAYSRLAQLVGVTPEQLSLRLNSTDAATLQLGGRTVVAYNDAQEIVPGRKRFTLAHELGHIVLDHFGRESYYREQDLPIPRDVQAQMEREADYFASVFLAPLEVAMAIIWPYRVSVYSLFALLRSAFRLSKEAAYYRSREILGRTSLLLARPERAENFDSYIDYVRTLYDQPAMDILTDRYRDEYDTTLTRIWEARGGKTYLPAYALDPMRLQEPLLSLQRLFKYNQ